jgi:septal ring factor EnvC (AmiA/AmiB activator)
VSYSFGLTIESLVAILLLLTIIYCARLNSRLEKLRANEGAMKASVAELVAATEAAQRAIAGLKATVNEAKETLDPKLREADTLSTELADNLRAGEHLLSHLRQIATARTSSAPAAAPATFKDPIAAPKPAAPDTRSMVAAAQAFAERTRTRTRGFAA